MPDSLNPSAQLPSGQRSSQIPGGVDLKSPKSPKISSRKISVDGSIAAPEVGAYREQLEKLAYERGLVRGSIPCEASRLATIDQSIAHLVDKLVEGEGGVLATLHTAIMAQYDRGQLADLEAAVTQRAHRLGLMQGRGLDEPAVEAAAKDLNSLLQSHSTANPTLYARFPELAQGARDLAFEVERKSIEMLHEAEKAAIGISASMRRFWPDFNKLTSILTQQTTETLPLLNVAMKERYGVTVLQDLQNVCARPLLGMFYNSELILRRTQHLLEGNPIAAAADGVALVLDSRRGNTFTALKAALYNLPSLELKFIKAEFDRSYSERFGSFASLATRFKAEQREVIGHFLRGDHATVNAIDLHTLLSGDRAAQIRAAEFLEEYSAAELPALADSYQNQYGVSLMHAIKNYVRENLIRERMLLWMRGNLEEHQLVSLRCAFYRFGKKTVAEFFLGVDAQTRDGLISRFESRYGVSFEQQLGLRLVRREFVVFKSKREYYMTRSVLEHGRLTDEEAIYQCVDGAGTDVQGIKEVLRHLREPEIIALGQRYTQLMKLRHNKAENMIKRLHSETSGDDRHDILQYERGWPTDAAGWLSRVGATHQHERSGLFRKIDLITREGPIMDRDVARLKAYFSRCTANGQKLTAREEMHVEFLGRTALRNFSAFRRSKNALAAQVANLAAATGSITVLVGTAHAGIPLHSNLPEIGGMVICASALMRYAVNKTLKGNGYAGEEMARDVVFGMVDGLAPVLAKFSPVGVLRRALNFGAKFGGKTAVLRVNKALHGSRIRGQENSAQELERLLSLADGAEPPSISRLTTQGGRSGANLCGVGQLDYGFEFELARLSGKAH